MTPSTEDLFFSFLFGAAAFQGIILAIVLWFRSSNNLLPNRLLSLLNLLLAILLLNMCYHLLNLVAGFPAFLYWPGTLWLLIPPLYYLYARGRLTELPKLYWRDLMHLLPFLVLIYLWQSVLFIPAEQKLELFQNPSSHANQSGYRNILQIMMPVQGLIYLGCSIYLISRYRKKNQPRLTETSIQQLRYLQILFGILLAYVMVAETLFLVPDLARLMYPWVGKTVSLVMALIIYSISYLALFDPSRGLDALQLAKPIFKSRQLPEDLAKRYALQLDELMQKEKLYLKPELTLEELAKSLAVQPRQLSRLLKQQFNCTFSNYINNYRLERVKQLMNDQRYDHFSLVAIAFEAGFNSKSTFNRIFKKQMGLTPSEYNKNRKEILNN